MRRGKEKRVAGDRRKRDGGREKRDKRKREKRRGQRKERWRKRDVHRNEKYSKIREKSK